MGYLRGRIFPPLRLEFVSVGLTVHHSLAESVHSHLGDESTILDVGIHTCFLAASSGTRGMPYLVDDLGYQTFDLHIPGRDALYESSRASAAIHIG